MRVEQIAAHRRDLSACRDRTTSHGLHTTDQRFCVRRDAQERCRLQSATTIFEEVRSERNCAGDSIFIVLDILSMPAIRIM